MNQSLLLSSGQFLSFLTILGMGFVYIVLGWLLSSILGDHADSHSADSSDGHGDSHDHNHETVSIFSPKVVAIFMVGFGAGGAIATHGTFGVVGSTLLGLATGVVFGVLGLTFMRALYSQQASSEIQTSEAIGRRGTVTIDIPQNGVGEVSLSLNGQYMTYSARSMSGVAIPRTHPVTVASTNGGGEILVHAIDTP